MRGPARSPGPGIPCRPATPKPEPGPAPFASGTPECLVDRLGGQRAGPRLRPDGQPLAGPIRRHAQRPRLLRELDRRPRRRDAASSSGISRRSTTTSGTTTSAPSPPTLRVPDVGRRRARRLLAADEDGPLFLLDRRDGRAALPGRGAAGAPGGRRAGGASVSPTQPFPTHPQPLHPPTLAPDDAFGFTPSTARHCRKLIESNRYEGIFTPPDDEGHDPVSRHGRAA